MIYKILQPAAHLRDFIKDYQLFYAVFDTKYPVPVKPFPATTQHSLVFYLRGSLTAFNPLTGHSNKFPRIAVNGTQVSNFNFHLSPEYLMFSVNFQPGALSKFLRLPLTELLDERIDAEAMLNPAIIQVYEQMSNAPVNETIGHICEAYLWKRIQTIKTGFEPIDTVSRMMAAFPAGHSIEKLAGHACLSVSQFERRFVQQTGVTPKLFNRINRFYSAYILKGMQPRLDWLSIAINTGYSDYQHLAKDFKEFSGTTPNSLLAAEAKAPVRELILMAGRS